MGKKSLIISFPADKRTALLFVPTQGGGMEIFMKGDICVLDENKICDDCGECEFCDLNPEKVCDNCGKCIEIKDNYAKIKIDEIKLN